MKIQVQQNIEYPSKDFDSHGRDLLETTYAVSLSLLHTGILQLNVISTNLVYMTDSSITQIYLLEHSVNLRRIYKESFGKFCIIRVKASRKSDQ